MKTDSHEFAKLLTPVAFNSDMNHDIIKFDLCGDKFAKFLYAVCDAFNPDSANKNRPSDRIVERVKNVVVTQLFNMITFDKDDFCNANRVSRFSKQHISEIKTWPILKLYTGNICLAVDVEYFPRSKTYKDMIESFCMFLKNAAAVHVLTKRLDKIIVKQAKIGVRENLDSITYVYPRRFFKNNLFELKNVSSMIDLKGIKSKKECTPDNLKGRVKFFDSNNRAISEQSLFYTSQTTDYIQDEFRKCWNIDCKDKFLDIPDITFRDVYIVYKLLMIGESKQELMAQSKQSKTTEELKDLSDLIDGFIGEDKRADPIKQELVSAYMTERDNILQNITVECEKQISEITKEIEEHVRAHFSSRYDQILKTYREKYENVYKEDFDAIGCLIFNRKNSKTERVSFHNPYK